MPGIFPDSINGGIVIRDLAGQPVAYDNALVLNALVPAATFDSTCVMTAMPIDCTAKMSPAQINAIVSEIVGLAVALTPTGEWDCASLTNLADAFLAWQAATDQIYVVADLTAAAALTGLRGQDIVHVINNGSAKWARYQVTAAGNGTWAGVTKVLLWTQDQAPAAHTHPVADLSNASADAKALLQAANYSAMRTLLGWSSPRILPGAAGLLSGEEGVAFDFLTRTAFINDYADTLSNSGRPDNLLTVTRASTKMVTNRNRLLASVAANTLAYDHDPVTGEARGVLIEPAATNVVLWCRDLTDAAWTKTNCTAAKDQTGPDGVSNSASKLTSSASNATCLQSITLASSSRRQSCWIKRVTGSGVVEMTTDNGATWTAVTVSASWARVTIPAQTLANPIVGFRIVTSGDAVAFDFIQNEVGPVETSEIETTTASATRSADAVSIATSLFPINAAQGTLFVESRSDTAYDASTFPMVAELYSDLGNRLGVFGYASSLYAFVTTGSVGQASYSIGSQTVGGVDRLAMAYALNDIAASLNGAAVVTDTSATIPTVTALAIGYEAAGGGSQYNGHVRRAVYFSRRMTNTELQTITA